MHRKGKAVSNNARLRYYGDLDDDTYSSVYPDTLDLRDQFLVNKSRRMWHRTCKNLLRDSTPALRMIEIVNEDDGSTDVEDQDAREKDVGERQVAVK
jgi:hypothetical protein